MFSLNWKEDSLYAVVRKQVDSNDSMEPQK